MYTLEQVFLLSVGNKYAYFYVQNKRAAAAAHTGCETEDIGWLTGSGCSTGIERMRRCTSAAACINASVPPPLLLPPSRESATRPPPRSGPPANTPAASNINTVRISAKNTITVSATHNGTGRGSITSLMHALRLRRARLTGTGAFCGAPSRRPNVDMRIESSPRGPIRIFAHVCAD